MRITLSLELRQQNFAVAPARRGTETPRRTATEAELEETVRARQADWLRLFNEPDVWHSAEKRRSMLQARWAYHDAVASWNAARRAAGYTTVPRNP